MPFIGLLGCAIVHTNPLMQRQYILNTNPGPIVLTSEVWGVSAWCSSILGFQVALGKQGVRLLRVLRIQDLQGVECIIGFRSF